MKREENNTGRRKLRLDKDTLRPLSASEIKPVAGGVPATGGMCSGACDVLTMGYTQCWRHCGHAGGNG